MSRAIRLTRALQESAIKQGIFGGATGGGGHSIQIGGSGIRPSKAFMSQPGFIQRRKIQSTGPFAHPPPPPGEFQRTMKLVEGGGGTMTTQAPGLTDTICSNLPSYLQGLCRDAGGFLGGRFQQRQPQGGGGTTTVTCPEGTIRINENCVALGDAFPGGDPFITGAGGTAVTGSFGLPGVTPVQEQRRHLKCPRGMVLGTDEVCYPKSVLPRRSGFRKWKGDRKPPVSVSDMQAIRQAARARDRVKRLAGDVGFSTKRKK